MKLTSAQIERTLSQFEAEAIPDSHPALPRLNELFGDHTFFLDSKGLNIVEPTAEPIGGENSGSEGCKSCELERRQYVRPGCSRAGTD
jgi:hypothetical protein